MSLISGREPPVRSCKKHEARRFGRRAEKRRQNNAAIISARIETMAAATGECSVRTSARVSSA